MSKTKEKNRWKDGLNSSAADIGSYHRKMVLMDNQTKAEKLAEEYVKDVADSVVGEERKALALDLAETKEKAASLKKSITDERKLLAKTNKTIRVKDQQIKDTPDEKERDLRKIIDLVIGIFCFIFAFAAIGISMSTMFTVVMSSGNPVFLENQPLAWAMSSVLGLGALAFEFFKRYLVTDKTKRLYGMSMYIITALLLVTWIVMFAILFGSAADQGIDIGDLLGSSAAGNSGNDPWMTAFTVIQLLAEFFIGCTFFMSGGDLFAKYSPTRTMDDPTYLDAQKRLDVMERDYAVFTKAMHENDARLSAIDSAVSLFTKNQMANYHQLRAQLLG